MRRQLQTWINNADNFTYLRNFNVSQLSIELAHVSNRLDDYYISLVGEIFSNLRLQDIPSSEWAQLGNAFLQLVVDNTEQTLRERGISKDDAALFSSASFYFGDFPASACLAMRKSQQPTDPASLRAACFDFLARPNNPRSHLVRSLQNDLKNGEVASISDLVRESYEAVNRALEEGPEAWILATLFSRLLGRFSQTNLRAVLPGGAHPFWTPLIRSLVDRQPSTWEFFPSQIQAIQRGLLENSASYAMQMPTGAGKTTLCETLLFAHLTSHQQDAAILLVPYRSLASELRGTLVRRLNAMGLPARCAYGGTVPSGDEIHGLDQIRAIIATPESLSGILSADSAFSQRISLVICDEGHLLDSGGRGIGLELLLARLRARPGIPPRVIFVSAIVPNIEEINAWLGGNNDTVIRSTYRPAIAEFAKLRPLGSGARTSVNIDIHPHEISERRFTVEKLLGNDNFGYTNPATGRMNTYTFTSIKTQAIAVARKVMPIGMTAIFAANKRGTQGAVGLAEELIKQLSFPLNLPDPLSFSRNDKLQRCIAYLQSEYGNEWIGTQSLGNGAVLHHGDIPQETREVLETLIRDGDIRLVICTSTLAEGVNLPIRSLILYSVQRRKMNGPPEAMLARDIKNLVGRAGRAGTNTKGLVICANPEQWQFVEPVATQSAGEHVKGALRDFIQRLNAYLIQNRLALNNEILEATPSLYPVIDGVDSTLIDLISEEVGEDDFAIHARQLADQTFAAKQLQDGQLGLLRNLFELRARRLVSLSQTGKLSWIRETGAKIRLLGSVEQILMPARERWQDPVDPMSDELRTALLEWAWIHRELRDDIVRTFRPEDDDPERVKSKFFELVHRWMKGEAFVESARHLSVEMDDLLAIHTRVITFSLQSLVDQGLSLLKHRLQAEGIEIAVGVMNFAEQLRYGAPNLAAFILASSGVRHRKAYVALGNSITQMTAIESVHMVRRQALDGLRQNASSWQEYLGGLVELPPLKRTRLIYSQQ
ncbi:DEAD/DEAH box helicase [Pantoea cypripedii]|uniref:DEAD/DEAH box helicase n=1 Tax=Pantoea cypripedii TaxID=55209 RepID=A0A6B9GFZ6_PANCY|nr:DEAD/DEAH box helicase [Pantoea cypripedii]QGY33227.1 DEAD/DEAH box helicase [Pantoea cypripedii]